MKRIYVAAPFTSDPVGNTVRAIEAANELRRAGFHPFVPHVACDWAAQADGYEAAMRECFEWVRACHALIRLPGASSGADREVALARELGIPVYASVAQAIEANL